MPKIKRVTRSKPSMLGIHLSFGVCTLDLPSPPKGNAPKPTSCTCFSVWSRKCTLAQVTGRWSATTWCHMTHPRVPLVRGAFQKLPPRHQQDQNNAPPWQQKKKRKIEVFPGDQSQVESFVRKMYSFRSHVCRVLIFPPSRLCLKDCIGFFLWWRISSQKHVPTSGVSDWTTINSPWIQLDS